MNLLKKFQEIDKNHKSMIFLNWIYTTGAIISWVFTTFYIYKTFWNSIEIILYFLILSFVFSFLWFSWIWSIFALYKKDIKYLYYVSYVLFFISFCIIFLSNFSPYFIILYNILYYLWNWAFRCRVHTQELAHIKDSWRDKYSSIISSWDNLIKFIVPIFITILFTISLYFNFNWYFILFLIMPVLYLLSFTFVNSIKSYIPSSKITKNDIKNFFSFKYIYLLLYFFWVWFYQWINYWGIITILFLHNEINIGLFQWIMSILSTIIVIFLIKKRKIEKRLKIYFFASLFSIINMVLFIFNLSLIWFFIYSLVLLLIQPIYRVSEHVYDLRSMDFIKHWDSDFFPAMVLREMILITWRIIPVLFLIYILNSWIFTNNILLIYILLTIITGQFLSFLSIYIFEKKWNNNL